MAGQAEQAHMEEEGLEIPAQRVVAELHREELAELYG
jgi:hypothetical protein|tara:strand:+ start:432 stop:542 length:111 start_codon:yes stop_codon:yes gene_type:complete